MVDNSPNKLLFIEPKDNTIKPPIIDTLTKKITASLRKATKINYCFGFYLDTCGCRSGGYELALPNKHITHSLAIHYIAYHRDEIPEEQLDTIKSLDDGEEIPTMEELLP